MPSRCRHLPGRCRALLAGAALLAMSGCAAYPTREELLATPPDLVPEVAASYVDGRARFRQIFCEVAHRDSAVQAADPQCESLLWRLPGEAPADARSPLPPIDPGLRFFLVTGALSDCFGPDALPYASGVRELAATGVPVATIRVSGRSSASHNAAQVAGVLSANQLAAGERFVLMGYSKGAIDILHFLDEYPDAAHRVAAVVSLAGPILGSPVAERSAWLYDHLLSRAFRSRCDPGDGGLVDSMLPEARRAWLAAHPLPAHVAYFSVAAFAAGPQIARSLRPSWRLLADADRHNDGQVLPGDAIIPGSTLLGHANADHWGLAIAVENELPHLAARPGGRLLPQAVLLEAILRQVSEALGAQGGST